MLEITEPTLKQLATFTGKTISLIKQERESSKVDTMVIHKCDVHNYQLDKLSKAPGVNEILEWKVGYGEAISFVDLGNFVGISREAMCRKSKNTKHPESYTLHVLAYKLAKVKELLNII